LNLSNKSTHENNSDISAEDDVYVSDNDDDLASNDESASNPLLPKPKSMVEPHDTNRDGSEKTEDKVNNNNGNGLPSGPQGLPGPGLLAGLPGLLANADAAGGGEGQLGSVYSLITNIQALIKVAVENAKKEERSKLEDGGNSKTDPNKPSGDLIHELEELKKNSQLNLRRLKKEKRYRKKLQEQLEAETKRRVQMEEALRMTSAETLKRITESLSRSESVVAEHTNSAADPDSKRAHSPASKDRRDSGDDQRSSPASSSTSNVAIAAAAAAAAAAAQFNATVSASEASSDRGTPPRDVPTTTTSTLGFAKNLFPQYSASSLFTSAN